MRRKVWIALAAFLLDRGTKILASRIPAGGAALIPGVLGLRRVSNTGMAFSLLRGHPLLLSALSLGILLGAFFLFRGRELPLLSRVGGMLMLGGALGNLADRLFFGAVTDFLEPLFVSFPIFNLADVFLVCGCGLVMLSLLRGDGTKAKEEAEDAE